MPPAFVIVIAGVVIAFGALLVLAAFAAFEIHRGLPDKLWNRIFSITMVTVILGGFVTLIGIILVVIGALSSGM
ncbi:hypothetical protein A2V54_00545 [candidate division WWE3 bacterium RBG_19FT_COMBO_53_11]|uniref:Uncharacterized protein n=1 Tax=candidate division WWE3 bacterium RBG_19FT_COMBO_53_11 TaxID=1802613 RepID=A0A1F4UIA3_UNCKA|nr:MAG: hypothetical protein A2155_02110 [candidate division WWE3 bacterium RBG_16_52_45]OGC44637.1 MAG: hypothetical protein A2V54_00545 [candidate division WWE3 bacterium RBG_19FT_COMBO_53_11]